MNSRPNHECTERTWGKLHEMDWDDAPRSLDTKLLEKCSSNNVLALDKGIRIKKSTTNDTYEDDAEPPAEDLRAIADGRAAGQGAQVCHDLSDCDSVGGELELVGKHCRVQILGFSRCQYSFNSGRSRSTTYSHAT